MNCLVVVVPVVEKYRHNRTVAVDRIGAEGGEEDEGVSSVVVAAGAVATAGEDSTGPEWCWAKGMSLLEKTRWCLLARQ